MKILPDSWREGRSGIVAFSKTYRVLPSADNASSVPATAGRVPHASPDARGRWSLHRRFGLSEELSANGARLIAACEVPIQDQATIHALGLRQQNVRSESCSSLSIQPHPERVCPPPRRLLGGRTAHLSSRVPGPRHENVTTALRHSSAV